MNGTILITGGAGFIGSHLAELMLSLGRRVVVIDDLSTGRAANLAHLPVDRVTLIRARVGEALADPRHVRTLAGVEQVYHLAAAVGVKLVVEEPVACVRNNIDETAAILDAAARWNAPILIASSSEVYGKNPTMPLAETQDLHFGPTTAPRWSYALSKALDEHLALAMAHSHGLKTVVVRLFNTIGPRQIGRYGMVVPRFVQRAVAGDDIQIYGDGRQTRSFCDVRDVVRAMNGLMAEPACFGQVFNVGSDHEITVEALADRVIELAGSPSRKVFVPYDVAYDAGFEDPSRRVPDLSRIRRAIGYAPTIPLDRTLEELIALARRVAAPEPVTEPLT